jgi:hypothetical protein
MVQVKKKVKITDRLDRGLKTVLVCYHNHQWSDKLWFYWCWLDVIRPLGQACITLIANQHDTEWSR